MIEVVKDLSILLEFEMNAAPLTFNQISHLRMPKNLRLGDAYYLDPSVMLHMLLSNTETFKSDTNTSRLDRRL